MGVNPQRPNALIRPPLMASVTDSTGEAFDVISTALVIIEEPVNSSSIIFKTSTTSCWACKSKERPSLIKTSFRELRKKDGSIGDFAECN